jgi:hypothetical protein
MQDGQAIAHDVKITGLRPPVGLWTSVVVTAGLAGVYVFYNGREVGGNSDFPWPPYDPKGYTEHDFTIGSTSSSPSSFLPASVGEVLVERRMWTEREAVLWHTQNAAYLTEHRKWLKYPANPVLAPAQAWEQDCLQEPNLLYEDGIYKLWYTGGYGPEYIGHATSADGFSWAKCPINPVLGQGNGGEPATACRGYVVKVDKTYYLFYNSNPPVIGDEKLATSPDGVHWTSQGVIIKTTDWPWGGMFGNVCVWVEDTTWFMIFEAWYNGTNAWEMGAATSDNGCNWRLLSPTPLRSLRIADGGTYGGPMVIKRGQRYHCWYHAAPTPVKDGRGPSFTAPNLPTAIYRATSSDLINWQVYSPIPVLSLTQKYEVDQIADPTFAEVNGRCLMLFDQMDNPNKRSRLGLATFNGTRDDLLTDSTEGGSPFIAVLDILLLQ